MITVRSLRAGTVLDQDIYDEKSIPLLRSGADEVARAPDPLGQHA